MSMTDSEESKSNSIPSDGNEGRLARNWIIFGMIAGLLGAIAFFIASGAIPLPFRLVMLLGFTIGPLLSLAFVGFYFFFRLHRKTVALQASVLFGVIAGTIFNMMLVVQSALFLTIPREARVDLGLAWDGLNMVQLGLDVSWDIYFTAATILLGIAMLSHPRFGKIWGGITLLIGAALLVLNLLTFPIPPADAGSIDLGPVSGLWYFVIMIRVLTSLKWVDERLEAARTSGRSAG
jgi:hypothetical protein